MTSEHSLLTGIRAAVETSGTHSQHWGELRRKAFAGPDAWAELKDWCAANALECELAFGQSSRATDVQFRRQRKA